VLTADLIRPFLRSYGRMLTVDQLDESDPLWLQTARDLLELFRQHQGQPRARWEEALESFEGTRVDYLRIRGLAKVLTDAATFVPKEYPLTPRELRARLFCRGPVFEHPDLFHPVTRRDLLQEAANELALSPEEVDEALFADHPGTHILKDVGPAWTSQGLLQRYNLELARGALYRATVVQIEIYDHFKECWRYLKLFKIMFVAKELPEGGYQVTLSGPLSDFVETERYGIAFAEFLPAVLLGERWNLVARVKSPVPRREQGAGRIAEDSQLLYRLDHTCGLQSHYRAGRVYDSSLERTFASEFHDFEEKFGAERGKWRLLREDQVLVLDGSVMIPDFLLVHTQDERRRILIELVGFWSPRYLQTKIAKVQAAQCPNLLLLVYENLKVTQQDFGKIPGEILFFKEKPVIKEVMAAVEALAEKVYGPLEKRERAPALPLPEMVQRCMQEQQGDEASWYSLESLSALLQQTDPSFTPRRYGYRTLSALLKDHPELFEVRKSARKGRPLEARFLATTPLSNSLL
jgi:predicted nuclease of restriction endonuclease-like RecB superfamily